MNQEVLKNAHQLIKDAQREIAQGGYCDYLQGFSYATATYEDENVRADLKVTFSEHYNGEYPPDDYHELTIKKVEMWIDDVPVNPYDYNINPECFC